MPLGIVNEEDFEKELEKIESKEESEESEDSSAEQRAPQIIEMTRGRGNNSTAVPESLQKLIGETHLTEGRNSALAIASFLGISKSSESAYAKGATSTSSYNDPKPSLAEHLNNKKLKISKRASSKLIQALDKMDEDKLNDLDAKELSSVAKDMSVIIKNFEPESNRGSGTNSPTIVFYAPKLASEEKFDVITVNE